MQHDDECRAAFLAGYRAAGMPDAAAEAAWQSQEREVRQRYAQAQRAHDELAGARHRYTERRRAEAPAKQAALPPETVWIAWMCGHGHKQQAIGSMLGVTASYVCCSIRAYIEAWLPDSLSADPWDMRDIPYITGDRSALLAEHFAGCPEPPRPERWHRETPHRLKRWGRNRQNLGRPIDMGGPRDKWLTFYPPADPREEPRWLAC
jgi:hypothetical protein